MIIKQFLLHRFFPPFYYCRENVQQQYTFVVEALVCKWKFLLSFSKMFFLLLMRGRETKRQTACTCRFLLQMTALAPSRAEVGAAGNASPVRRQSPDTSMNLEGGALVKN